ncbi:MAG: IS66 family transposase [Leptospirales bacterium]
MPENGPGALSGGSGRSCPVRSELQIVPGLYPLRLTPPFRSLFPNGQDLFGALACPATIQNTLIEMDKALDGFSEVLEQEILKSPLAHADESGVRVDSSLSWLHVLSTTELTWYGVHEKRGGIALSDFGLLPRFRGRLIHDCWAPYFAFDIPHGLCNAHLCRERVFMEEVLEQDLGRPPPPLSPGGP